MKDSVSQRLIGKIRSGESFTRAEELALVIRLSIPAILAQFANVLMQYIDAAMVGNLGAVEVKILRKLALFIMKYSPFISGPRQRHRPLVTVTPPLPFW